MTTAIIDGILYDSDKAERIDTHKYVHAFLDGVCWPMRDDLYRTERGRYFICHTSISPKSFIMKILCGFPHDLTDIRPLTKSEAKKKQRQWKAQRNPQPA